MGSVGFMVDGNLAGSWWLWCACVVAGGMRGKEEKDKGEGLKGNFYLMSLKTT